VLLFPKTAAGRENAPRAPIHAGFPARPTTDSGISLARIKNPLGRRAARLAGAALLAVALAAGGGQLMAAAPPDEPVTLNFLNADVDAVVKAVAEITGRNFIVDPKVKGTINIVSARPVPRSLVYPTLLSALRMQGFAAIESDGIVKIVPEPDAKQQGGAVVRGPVGAGGDRLVTQVVTLRYESAAQLVNVLRPLITPNNTIAAYPGSNALIITDYADNLRRLEKIIASLDQAPTGEPLLVPVRYASAIDLVPMLNRLLVETPTGATPGDAQQRIVLVADPRSNSILVRSDNPGRAARVKQLVEQLDTPTRAGGNMYIVYLRHAEAVRVAQTLRALLTGSDGGGAGAGSAAGATGAGQPSLASAMAAGQPATPLPIAAGALGTSPAASVAFSAGGATIQADSANNALVIMAPEPVYNNLRAVIDKLDVRRAQVYVEALIVEVAAEKAAEFGIQWQVLGGIGKDNWQGVGGTNFGARGSGNNIIDTAQNLASVGQGLNLGVMNGTVTIPGVGTVLNLAFLARALETQAGANILSTPTLLTLDNEEARIMVGQNVPFVTGQYATTGGTNTVTPFQTVERRDVGLMLRVKPQITEGGTVRLVIYQEVSRIDYALSSSSQLILQKRSLESSVVIDDQQVVVLGGLIQDSMIDGGQQVPLLGSIPLVGSLFRYDNRNRTKTNLMVFLKPTVVRASATGREFTSERYDYLLNQQQQMRPEERLFWSDTTIPMMPPPGTMPGSPAASPPAPAPKPQ
jgi:general secretion pathway protein D